MHAHVAAPSGPSSALEDSEQPGSGGNALGCEPQCFGRIGLIMRMPSGTSFSLRPLFSLLISLYFSNRGCDVLILPNAPF